MHNGLGRQPARLGSGYFRLVLVHGLGLDPVEELGQGAFDILANVAGNDKKEHVVAWFECSGVDLGHHPEYAGAIFDFGANLFDFDKVRVNGDFGNGRMVGAGSGSFSGSH